jgi:NADH-ubiquinone oxidoreductase chain 6
VLVITSKNPVISILFLISTFINAAGYLILSGVGFIGISYIIIYIGAITILFLFVIMMINIRLSDLLETGTQYTKTIPLALCIASLFIFLFFTILPFTFNNVSSITNILDLFTSFNSLFLTLNTTNLETVYLTNSPVIADTSFTNFLEIESIGQGLYTFGAFWLILVSVILLLSMVAPIFLSQNKKGDVQSSSIANEKSNWEGSSLLSTIPGFGVLSSPLRAPQPYHPSVTEALNNNPSLHRFFYENNYSVPGFTETEAQALYDTAGPLSRNLSSFAANTPEYAANLNYIVALISDTSADMSVRFIGLIAYMEVFNLVQD